MEGELQPMSLDARHGGCGRSESSGGKVGANGEADEAEMSRALSRTRYPERVGEIIRSRIEAG